MKLIIFLLLIFTILFPLKAETNDYLPFHKLTTDWYTLEPGKKLSMNLNIYFPYHLGNEYQASSLQAKFTFECNIPKNKELHINMQNPTSHHVTFHVPETGDASRMILSGSMENELMTGSTVIVKKTKDVKENDIIFFITKDGTPVIHRYIATDEAGKLITKGDANPKEDLEKVGLDQVQGKVLFH